MSGSDGYPQHQFISTPRPLPGRTRAARVLAAATLIGGLSLPPAAFAHGDEADVPARQSVLQALAYLVNTPDDMDAIADKLNDAKDSTDRAGVDIAEVDQAMKALDVKNMPLVRSLLERSIGARPDLTGLDVRHVLQVPPGLTAVNLATGEQPGTAVVTDEMPGRGDLSAVDSVLIAIAAAAAAAGVLLSIRLRPRHSVRALRRSANHPLGG